MLGAFAGYTVGRDPLDPSSEFSGERYRGTLTFRITRGFSAGASYQVWITDCSIGYNFSITNKIGLSLYVKVISSCFVQKLLTKSATYLPPYNQTLSTKL